MKILVTAKGKQTSDAMDPRFGRAKFFIMVDTNADATTVHDNSQNLNAAQGAGIQAAETVSRLGAEAVVTGNVGPKAFRALNAADIKIYLSNDATVADAIRRFKAGELKEVASSNVQGHWS